MRGREFFLGEHVAGGLILGDVVVLRHDFQFVERAAHEKRLRHHSVNDHGRLRHHPHLLARARQIIFGVGDAVVAEIADARLAALAKFDQVGANLFELGPAGGERCDAHHKSANVRIAACCVDRVEVVVEHGSAAATQVGEEIGRALLVDLADRVDHEHGVRRQPRRLRSRPDDDDEKQNQESDYERSPFSPGHRRSSRIACAILAIVRIALSG